MATVETTAPAGFTPAWSEPPVAANDNWGMASAWETPAECLRSIRRMKAEAKRDLAADFRLRACPEHRQYWETLIEVEKCARWQFYGERDE